MLQSLANPVPPKCWFCDHRKCAPYCVVDEGYTIDPRANISLDELVPETVDLNLPDKDKDSIMVDAMQDDHGLTDLLRAHKIHDNPFGQNPLGIPKTHMLGMLWDIDAPVEAHRSYIKEDAQRKKAGVHIASDRHKKLWL